MEIPGLDRSRFPGRQMQLIFHDWSTEGFDTADLKDVKALLDGPK